MNILPDASMEVILTKIVQKFKIENATWNQNNEMRSVTFSLASGVLHDQVLKLFKYWGNILQIDVTKSMKFNESV